MPPKEKPSKKAVKEKQTRVIEDATFGLKNKNKSKKVQQFINRVEKTVKYNTEGGDVAKAKDAKKEAKLVKQLQEEELRILFNEGISNQFGKKKTIAQQKAQEMGIADTSADVAKLLDELSSDSETDEDDDGDLHPGSSTRGLRYDDDDEPIAIEIFREKTIEDIIEEQRAKLAAEGKKGTPVTAESFAIWRAGKLAKRQEEAEARMRAEQAKKKGGKGLSILSGKELFNYNASLFVDDDEAINAEEESALNIEHQKEEEAEELREQQERERAEQEQLRLIEMIKIEEAENERQDKERYELAHRADHETFMLGEIVINKIVFDIRENEDLEPFPEDETDEEEEEEEEEDDDDEYDEDEVEDGENEEEEDQEDQVEEEGDDDNMKDGTV